jgi:hypothetical protein
LRQESATNLAATGKSDHFITHRVLTLVLVVTRRRRNPRLTVPKVIGQCHLSAGLRKWVVCLRQVIYDDQQRGRQLKEGDSIGTAKPNGVEDAFLEAAEDVS